MLNSSFTNIFTLLDYGANQDATSPPLALLLFLYNIILPEHAVIHILFLPSDLGQNFKLVVIVLFMSLYLCHLPTLSHVL